MGLRITGGEFGGRIIKSAPSLKPAMDKVRKAIFDILGEKIIDANFLDLFAGSGAVGIEALSRGASRTVFIDKDRNHYNLIKQNLKLLKITDNTAVRLMTVEDFIKANESSYDIVFAAPWYNNKINIDGWEKLLASKGILIIEHHSNTEPPQNKHLRLFNQKKYGDTHLALYTRA